MLTSFATLTPLTPVTPSHKSVYSSPQPTELAATPSFLYKYRVIQPAVPLVQTFDIDASFKYEVGGMADFIFQIHVHDGMDQQILSESLVSTPEIERRISIDRTFGHRMLRMQAQSGPVDLHYRARVKRTTQPLDLNAREMPIDELPDEILHDLYPTRFCESDELSKIAQEMFGQLPKGLSRVQAITDWIHNNIAYQIGTSHAMTTARDTLANRTGVCRDFAHLGVTFCRALNIPARFVVGYAWFEDPPPDFHAVFEAYLGGRWVMFDPTYMSPIDNLVRIATGSDAKDVAFATIYGPATMTFMAPFLTQVGLPEVS